MKIYIIRHGETDMNRQGLFQGQSNIALNSHGMEQASLLSFSLKDSKLDYIYSSPLDRAIQTAKAINKYHNAEIIINKDIIERSLGELEGKKYSDLNLPDLWSHILNLNNITDSSYGVETLQHMLDRAYNFLDMLIKKYKNIDANVLISSHGSFIVALLLILGEIDPSFPLSEVKLPNCCCYVIEKPKIKLDKQLFNNR